MADPPFQQACDPERTREVGSAWCPAQECGCWPKNWQQWGRAPAAGEINRWWTKPSSSRLSTNNQKQQTNNGNKQLGESDRWWTVSSPLGKASQPDSRLPEETNICSPPKRTHMCQQQLSSRAVFFVVTQTNLSVYSRKFLVSLFSSQFSPVSNAGCLTRLGCEQS